MRFFFFLCFFTTLPLHCALFNPSVFIHKKSLFECNYAKYSHKQLQFLCQEKCSHRKFENHGKNSVGYSFWIKEVDLNSVELFWTQLKLNQVRSHQCLAHIVESHLQTLFSRTELSCSVLDSLAAYFIQVRHT